jgi:hypothetical protein
VSPGNSIACSTTGANALWYGQGAIAIDFLQLGADATGAAGWTQGYVLEDGAVQRPIGAPGSGAYYEWDVTAGRGTVSIGSGSTAPVGTVLELQYLAVYPFHAIYSAGSPPRTYRETHPEIIDYAAGVALAESIYARESVDRRELEVVTDVDGFLPGQALDVDTTYRGGITAIFLVASVRVTLINDDIWEYALTGQQSDAYQGSYVEQWKTLTSGGSGSAAPAASLTPSGTAVSLTGDVVGATSGSIIDTTLVATAVAGEGLEDDGANNLQVKLDGATLERSAAGLKVASGIVSPALVLLETRTASASASLNFTTRNAPGQSGATFQSDYDEYLIEIVNIVNGSAAIPRFRCSTNGGSSYDAGANYDWGWGFVFNGTPGSIFGAGASGIDWRNGNTTLAANGSWNGSLRLFAPLGALYKAFIGQIAMRDNSSGQVFFNGGGSYNSVTAVNALQAIPSAGTFTSGAVRIYGVAK